MADSPAGLSGALCIHGGIRQIKEYRIAVEAERLNHHPDVVLRYPDVTIRITTHDAGGITEKDLDLARRIDALAGAADRL